MACCALAAFLIGEFLLLWGRIRGSDAGMSATATAWRPGERSPQATGRDPRRRWGTGLAMAGAFGLAGAAYAAAGPPRVELGDTGIMVTLCGGETDFLQRIF